MTLRGMPRRYYQQMKVVIAEYGDRAPAETFYEAQHRQ